MNVLSVSLIFIITESIYITAKYLKKYCNSKFDSKKLITYFEEILP